MKITNNYQISKEALKMFPKNCHLDMIGEWVDRNQEKRNAFKSGAKWCNSQLSLSKITKALKISIVDYYGKIADGADGEILYYFLTDSEKESFKEWYKSWYPKNTLSFIAV